MLGSEISLSIYEGEARKKSRKRSDMADDVTGLAQFYALYSHKARSFNQ